jgi:hypothetical protein
MTQSKYIFVRKKNSPDINKNSINKIIFCSLGELWENRRYEWMSLRNDVNEWIIKISVN